MKFLVSEIRDAHHVERTDELDPQILIAEPPSFVFLRRPLKAKVQAQMTQNDIIVSGEISTIISLQCGRCLETVEQPFVVSFQQVFSPELKEIDLSQDIRESVLVDLPFKALCKEDCRGLCATCGKNKNIASCTCSPQSDPRWDTLKQFPFK